MLDFPINHIGALPGLELQIIQDKILLFLFCSIRISAFLISSPIFGAGYVMLPVRILFGMVFVTVRKSGTPKMHWFCFIIQSI